MKTAYQLLVLLFAIVCKIALAGPIGTYYIVDWDPGNTHTMLAVSGSSTGRTTLQNAYEAPLAVVGSEVRTIGYGGYVTDKTGSGYADTPGLALTPTGSYYSNPLTDAYCLDGTSGRGHNYAVCYSSTVGGSIAIYQFDSHWANPVAIPVHANLRFGYDSITYDPWNNSFWLMDAFGYSLANIDMNGNLIAEHIIDMGHQTGLAMDVDHTLWAVGFTDHFDYSTPNVGMLYHYSTDGTLLGTERPDDFAVAAVSGEIALNLAEPDTLALYAAAIVSLKFAMRRGRACAAKPMGRRMRSVL